MTPSRGRIACHLTALLISLAASGCFIPGGGWTMRTGVDLRRYKKPSAFFELVDTRWDEYNRIAELNLIPEPTPSPAVFVPAAGPGLMEGVPVPPASDRRMMPDSSRPSVPSGDRYATSTSTPPEPQFPGNPTGSNPPGGSPPVSNSPGANSNGPNSNGDEPNRLPEADDVPVSATLPRNVPAARRSVLDGPPMAASTTGDAATDLPAAPASAPAAKRSRRPMASRLFSRPQ